VFWIDGGLSQRVLLRQSRSQIAMKMRCEDRPGDDASCLKDDLTLFSCPRLRCSIWWPTGT